MIKHALFFAGAMLLTAVLLRGSDEGTMIVTGVLVPLWLVTSPMMRKRPQHQVDDCSDYL